MVVMLNDGPLAAVTPVANELDVVPGDDKCAKTIARLVAVRPVTSESGPSDEHMTLCKVKERSIAVVVQYAHCLTNMLERNRHAR